MIAGQSSSHDTWGSAWNDRGFKLHLVLSLAALIAALELFSSFVVQIEQRVGVVLPDPILHAFQPVDVTVITFALVYSGIITAFVALIRKPRALMHALQAYTAMVCLRMAAMYCLPLEPPPSMIPLVDPLVESVAVAKTLTKDLFFSGHTATLFLLYLCIHPPLLRRIFIFGSIAVGCLVILQHVHYSIDVLAAPFFAYGAFRLTGRLRKQSQHAHQD